MKTEHKKIGESISGGALDKDGSDTFPITGEKNVQQNYAPGPANINMERHAGHPPVLFPKAIRLGGIPVRI